MSTDYNKPVRLNMRDGSGAGPSYDGPYCLEAPSTKKPVRAFEERAREFAKQVIGLEKYYEVELGSMGADPIDIYDNSHTSESSGDLHIIGLRDALL